MSSYTVEAVLKASGVSGFQKAFANASDSMGKFQKTGEAMSNLGGKLTKGLTLPIVGVGTAALLVGKDFESAMSQVGATTGAGAKDMQMLEDVAREMGATTKYSAKRIWSAIKKLVA